MRICVFRVVKSAYLCIYLCIVVKSAYLCIRVVGL